MAFVPNVVVPFVTFRISGLEEEAAASRLGAKKQRRRLNDLENHHETLSRAALDAVMVVRPEGHSTRARLGARWR